ncbi:SpvB/TcaC N-terminal domain-containing protein [Pseudonocardia ailaonensis]|uniref:SpvB/TcaC N-terminal domain-containing protein n=1 Tax=Pseudonocardia ailaonensis TaxID=367279 RepID=UPI003CD05D95
MNAGNSSGAFTTSVPIIIPPFHGHQPGIELQYNSAQGNDWRGVGWRVSGPSTILRLSKDHGVPNLADNDVFQLDGRDLRPCNRPAERPDHFEAGCTIPPPEPTPVGSAPPVGCSAASSGVHQYFTTGEESGQLICRTTSPGDLAVDLCGHHRLRRAARRPRPRTAQPSWRGAVLHGSDT